MNDLSHLCGASWRIAITDDMSSVLGPCLLRVGHNGPLHQDSDGVQWTRAAPLPDRECEMEASESGNGTDWEAVAREMEIRLKNETVARIEAEGTLARVRDWFTESKRPDCEWTRELGAILNRPKETQ